jgi:hypothetical protein
VLKDEAGALLPRDTSRRCVACSSNASATFNGAEVVLRDLARSTAAAKCGCAIQHHLKLTPDQLWELYSGRPANEE